MFTRVSDRPGQSLERPTWLDPQACFGAAYGETLILLRRKNFADKGSKQTNDSMAALLAACSAGHANTLQAWRLRVSDFSKELAACNMSGFQLSFWGFCHCTSVKNNFSRWSSKQVVLV